MSVEETHSEFDQLISRYLSGELSPEEERDFQNILNSDSRLRTRFDEFQKIWDAAHTPVSDSGYDLDAEWKLIKAQIPELKAEKEMLWLELSKKRAAAYDWIGKNPEKVLEWFGKYMK
jgi:hypothetical protein